MLDLMEQGNQGHVNIPKKETNILYKHYTYQIQIQNYIINNVLIDKPLKIILKQHKNNIEKICINFLTLPNLLSIKHNRKL